MDIYKYAKSKYANQYIKFYIKYGGNPNINLLLKELLSLKRVKKYNLKIRIYP